MPTQGFMMPNTPTYTTAINQVYTADTVWVVWNQSYVSTSTTAGSTILTTPQIIGSGAATSQINIWGSWNTEYMATTNVVTTAPYRSRTPAEVAAQAARDEEWRQQRAVTQAIESKARDRAEVLLKESLSDRQKAELAAHGYFGLDVLSRNGERRHYRIRRGRSRNVQQVDASGRVLKHLCAHPSEMVPDADTMLAQKLWLETQEDEFLRIANHS